MAWIDNGESGSSIRAKFNALYATVSALVSGSGSGSGSSSGSTPSPNTGPLRFFIEGHSIAQAASTITAASAMYHALARYPTRLVFDPVNGGLAVGASGMAFDGIIFGGQNTGILHPTRLARVAAALAAGTRIGVLHMINNDTSIETEVYVARLRYWHEYMRARGLVHLFLLGASASKQYGSAAAAARTLSLDRASRQYALENSDVTWVPMSGAYADPASDQFAPIGGNSGGAGAPTYDGTHPNSLGGARGGIMLGRAFAEKFPDPWALECCVAGGADGAATTRSNVLTGGRARWAGTGGNTTNTNCTLVGGANVPAGAYLSDGEAAVTLKFEQANCQWAADRLGRPTYTATKVTISGTPTADGQFGIGLQGNFPVAANGLYDVYATIYCEALTGLRAIGVNANYSNMACGYPGDPTTDSPMDPITGPFRPSAGKAPLLIPSGEGSNLSSLGLAFWYYHGQPVSGSFWLLDAVCARHDAMPVAAADPGAGNAPVLAALTTSSTNFTAGTAFSTTINGRTAGSTITATSSDGTALTVSGSTLTGTFAAAGSKTVTLVETLSGATGSPKTSTITATVNATVTLGALTLATASATATSAWSSAITGKTSGSTVTATSSDGTTLTVSAGVVSGTFASAGTKTISLVETLSGATGSPKTSTATVTVAAAPSGFNFANSGLTQANGTRADTVPGFAESGTFSDASAHFTVQGGQLAIGPGFRPGGALLHAGTLGTTRLSFVGADVGGSVLFIGAADGNSGFILNDYNSFSADRVNLSGVKVTAGAHAGYMELGHMQFPSGVTFTPASDRIELCVEAASKLAVYIRNVSSGVVTKVGTADMSGTVAFGPNFGLAGYAASDAAKAPASMKIADY